MPDIQRDYEEELERQREEAERAAKEQEVFFDNIEQWSQYAKNQDAAINEMYGDTEYTVDADTAREISIGQMNLEEEEAIIEQNLQDGHYVNGDDVAAIHQKYEKLMDDAKRAAKEAANEASRNGTNFDEKQAVKDAAEKLTEERNKEIKKLCEEAPKYNMHARDMIRKKQLYEKESGRPVKDVKIYRKEKDNDKLLTTVYGRNRIGEFNKQIRNHEAKAAAAKDNKAKRQADKLGYSTKDFLRGDAESICKGGVAMTLHAALFFINKLAQAGNKAMQFALYEYALHKLNMDDIEALQKAINNMEHNSMDGPGEMNAYKEVSGLPGFAPSGDAQTLKFGGEILPIDYSSDVPSLGDMDVTMFYDDGHDVMGMWVMYMDEAGDLHGDMVYCGSEDNLRSYFGDMGLSEDSIDETIAENAEKVKALGLEDFMVENVNVAFDEAAKNASKDVQEVIGIDGPVLEPCEEDCMDIVNERDVVDEGGFREVADDSPSEDEELDDIDAILRDAEEIDNFGEDYADEVGEDFPDETLEDDMGLDN